MCEGPYDWRNNINLRVYFYQASVDTSFTNSKWTSSRWCSNHLVSHMHLWVAQEAGSWFLLYFHLKLSCKGVWQILNWRCLAWLSKTGEWSAGLTRGLEMMVCQMTKTTATRVYPDHYRETKNTVPKHISPTLGCFSYSMRKTGLWETTGFPRVRILQSFCPTMFRLHVTRWKFHLKREQYAVNQTYHLYFL